MVTGRWLKTDHWGNEFESATHVFYPAVPPTALKSLASQSHPHLAVSSAVSIYLALFAWRYVCRPPNNVMMLPGINVIHDV